MNMIGELLPCALDRRIEQLKRRSAAAQQRLAERQCQAEAEVAVIGRSESAVAQLPIWSDEVRAHPNESCRAALFTVRRACTRRLYTSEDIFVVGDGKITYTGIELRAENDELVWLQILHYAKNSPLGHWVEFTPHQLCLDIGWRPGGPNYQLLRNCLLRLKATALTIESKRVHGGLALSLIGDFHWHRREGQARTPYAVQVPREIRHWFSDSNFTRVQWEKYRSLPPVSRRLFDYAASHRDPYALRVETVYRLCGSDAESIENFRKVLRRAVHALNASGLLRTEMTRAGLVRFQR